MWVLFLTGDFYFFVREIIERPTWDLHVRVTWVWRENGTYIKQPLLKYSGALPVESAFSEPVSLQSGYDTTCFSPEGYSFLKDTS